MRLAPIVEEICDEWSLEVDGAPIRGRRAVVVRVRTASGRPAALKVGLPGVESRPEHLALQAWHGNGAVELLRADPHRQALLLERLHHTNLDDLWDLEACEIVAALYGRLHLAALPQLRTLSSYVEQWTLELSALPRAAPIPPRLVQQAVAVGRGFLDDPSTDARLLHADLHYRSVLSADREPWLAIDPAPLTGDPHYELAPMLWNRYDELAGDYRDGVRRRFHTLVDAAGFDEHRARDWVVFRMVCNAMLSLQRQPGGRRTASDDAWLTMCIAIAKAVQD